MSSEGQGLYNCRALLLKKLVNCNVKSVHGSQNPVNFSVIVQGRFCSPITWPSVQRKSQQRCEGLTETYPSPHMSCLTLQMERTADSSKIFWHYAKKHEKRLMRGFTLTLQSADWLRLQSWLNVDCKFWESLLRPKILQPPTAWFLFYAASMQSEIHHKWEQAAYTSLGT